MVRPSLMKEPQFEYCLSYNIKGKVADTHCAFSSFQGPLAKSVGDASNPLIPWLFAGLLQAWKRSSKSKETSSCTWSDTTHCWASGCWLSPPLTWTLSPANRERLKAETATAEGARVTKTDRRRPDKLTQGFAAFVKSRLPICVGNVNSVLTCVTIYYVGLVDHVKGAL